MIIALSGITFLIVAPVDTLSVLGMYLAMGKSWGSNLQPYSYITTVPHFWVHLELLTAQKTSLLGLE